MLLTDIACTHYVTRMSHLNVPFPPRGKNPHSAMVFLPEAKCRARQWSRWRRWWRDDAAPFPNLYEELTAQYKTRRRIYISQSTHSYNSVWPGNLAVRLLPREIVPLQYFWLNNMQFKDTLLDFLALDGRLFCWKGVFQEEGMVRKLPKWSPLSYSASSFAPKISTPS